MRFLGSRRWRIFLIAWILYSVHFATNVVREHYPAFSLAEAGTLRVDLYQGFHPDIFVHRDGHSYINNQVTVSVLAAVPLFVFDPLLDALEQHSKRLLSTNEHVDTTYRTDKPLRVAFFRRVKERGLDLRFGAATAITSVFLMAPCSALLLVLFFSVLRRREVGPQTATWLTFLLGFGTPIFFRTSTLSHNLFLMYAMFLGFTLLWEPAGTSPISVRNRLMAGFCGGLTVAVDYMGVAILPVLYGYLLLKRASETTFRVSLRESLIFIAGTIPPVVFLMYTQWSMFGNPFLPAQSWMPSTVYSNMGANGFSWPAPDLFFLNLFSPGYGMYTWAPLLLIGLVPVSYFRYDHLILERDERRFVAAAFLVLLIFSSANQFARLQWNSGFRYLVPLVPLIFLALSDHLVRMRAPLRVAVSVVSVLHVWVLTVFRENSVQGSWRLFLEEGVQLPWLRVLSRTSSQASHLATGPIAATVVLSFTCFVVFLIWRWGARIEAQSQNPALTLDSISPQSVGR